MKGGDRGLDEKMCSNKVFFVWFSGPELDFTFREEAISFCTTRSFSLFYVVLFFRRTCYIIYYARLFDTAENEFLHAFL